MGIGILTSGGDAPGMNAAIRAAIRYANHKGRTVDGIYYGYQGLCEGGNNIKGITAKDVAQIINRGGTILRSARYLDFKINPGVREEALRIMKRMDISNLIVIGGDGSFKGAQALFNTNIEKNVIENLFIVGIPASIDNDIPYTNFSIGTDTALNTAVECIDKLRDTAYSHRRVFVIQIMGRDCDYLPHMIGISAGASYVFPPDYSFKITKDENSDDKIDISHLTEKITFGFRAHKDFFMVIVAEGVSKALEKIEKYGSYTPADIISREINNDLNKMEEKNVSVRPVVLGHVQRGGTPSHFDRMLATRLGVHAVKEIIENENKHVKPIMVCLQNADGVELNDTISSVSLEKVLKAQIPKCGETCRYILKCVTR
jgi:6-phosphofructokinase 1